MKLRNEFPCMSMETLCGLYGYSRQAYYQYKEKSFAASAIEQTVLQAVRSVRQDLPGIGMMKLYVIIKDVFGDSMPGRDWFLRLMRVNGLTQKKKRGYRTTNSFHHYRKWPNIIKGYTPEAPNRLWVADITYIRLKSDVCYLHLITDVYSHKIVGWALAPTLEASYSLMALDMAIKDAGDCDFSQLIHHSDRGSQYCSYLYVNRLTQMGIRISMTESGNPTDNAIAERVNGILKQEWGLNDRLASIVDCQEQVARAIACYNDLRPHMSIGMMRPSEVYSGQPPGQPMWHKPDYAKIRQQCGTDEKNEYLCDRQETPVTL